MEDFDRVGDTKLDVFCAVDDSRSSLADLGDESVVSEDFADEVVVVVFYLDIKGDFHDLIRRGGLLVRLLEDGIFGSWVTHHSSTTW